MQIEPRTAVLRYFTLQPERLIGLRRHGGPKTYLAIQNLGWSIERFVNAMRAERPGIILVDVPNTNKQYLMPFSRFLTEEYIYMGEIDHLEVFRLDELHFLFSHHYGTCLTLYWWSQPDTPRQGQIAVRWLPDSGELKGAWHIDSVDWLPGYASLSQHLIPESGIARQRLELCIILPNSNPNDPICQGNSAILDLASDTVPIP
ncbi:MAG: hypothetical protein HYZ26_11350 [Chloroflexi bacterium]|nr:hypothetical protein [Chloroflexota bacterium]